MSVIKIPTDTQAKPKEDRRRGPHVGRRRLIDIQAAVEECRARLWYTIHREDAEAVRSGWIKILDKVPADLPRDRYKIRQFWEGGLAAAKRHEKTYGFDREYPLDMGEFEMGQGKLSALRWVLGCEWDFLDL